MPKFIQIQKKQLDDFQKGRIIGQWKSGIAKKEIARRLKKDVRTIRNHIKIYQKTGSCSRKIGSGRPKITTAREDRLIVRKALKSRDSSSSSIKKDLKLNVSNMTIINRLHNSNIKSHVAAEKPFISKTNLKKRLDFAKEHQNWTIDQWKNVLFSDESPIFLHWACKKLIWRRKNERFLPACMKGTVKHDKKINVWGCFAANGVGELHRIKGNMNAKMYHSILVKKMVPSAKKLFGNTKWIFQHDNDPKHTAGIIKNYLQNKNITVLKWHAQSPDINPIENLWAHVKQKMKDYSPSNEDELFQLLTQEWNKIDNEFLYKLIESMPRRCQSVIQNKGYPTKY